MLIEAVAMVAEWTTEECLEAYQGTTDAMVRSVCQWRLLSPGEFAKLVDLTKTPVTERISATVTKERDPETPRKRHETPRKSPATGAVFGKVLQALDERERWTAEELAVYCECKVTTVRVVMWQLRKAGHSIGGPAGGGYYLHKVIAPAA